MNETINFHIEDDMKIEWGFYTFINLIKSLLTKYKNETVTLKEISWLENTVGKEGEKIKERYMNKWELINELCVLV